MKTRRSRAHGRGFTLLEIMIVVTILGLLVALALPNFLKSRNHARKMMCIENLSQIESAKQLWGLENARRTGDEPTRTDLIGVNGYIKAMPECQAGGEYRFNSIGTNATCNIPDHVLNP
jgi:prepilin-type N-terminal cleavage/methylation domain-containing protein